MAGWILLLEDDLDGREVLAELLSVTGYEVVACANVSEAEAALAPHGRPTLVLTDFMLQEMPGTDFVARMRSRPGYEYVPVIYVTGMEPSVLVDVRDPIVTKPFDVDHLLELVAQLCPVGG